MKNRQSKIFGALYFACIISCVLLSAYLVSDVWGRYFSGTSGGDGARVARFDVSAESTMGDVIDLSFSENDPSVQYPYSITNNSEVAISYDIILTLPSVPDVPFNISFKVGDVSAEEIEDNVYCLKKVETIPANSGKQERKLEITTTNFDNGVDLKNIQVKIIISQVD